MTQISLLQLYFSKKNSLCFTQLGTVPGGTQLQGFKSVGTYNHGIKSDLSLNHNSTIYVTVVATNLAGVSTKVGFTPIVVDMTPPVISALNDGPGEDRDYQTSYTIEANWNFADNESSIDYCNWAIGKLINHNLLSM